MFQRDTWCFKLFRTNQSGKKERRVTLEINIIFVLKLDFRLFRNIFSSWLIFGYKLLRFRFENQISITVYINVFVCVFFAFVCKRQRACVCVQENFPYPYNNETRDEKFGRVQVKVMKNKRKTVTKTPYSTVIAGRWQ